MRVLFLFFIFGITFFLPTLAQITTSNSTTRYAVSDGGQAEISCLTDNLNATLIKWKIFETVVGEAVSSTDFNHHSNFEVSENSSLIVTNPRNGSLQGVINVTCIASSNSTNSSRMYQVLLYKAPSITNSKLIYDVPDDGSTETTITCIAAGFPQPNILWMFQNVTLPKEELYFVNNTDVPGANLTVSNDDELKVTSINRHGGFGLDVVCLANNTAGEVIRQFLVRFLKAPKILTGPKDIAVSTGVSSIPVRIPCRTIGYPTPSIHWVFGDVRLNATSDKLEGVHVLGAGIVSYEVYENGSLLIDNAKDKKHFEYDNFTCVASSFLGVDKQSHSFFLGETQSFSFDIVLANVSQFENRTAIEEKIETVFKGNSSLRSVRVVDVNVVSGFVRFHITWFEIYLQEQGYLSDNNLHTAKIAEDIYKELVENGVAIKSFLMDGKPGPVTDLEVDDVGKEEISFSWRKPAFFNVTGYQIQINEGSDWKNFEMVDDGDKTSSVIDGLESGTKYRIRMLSVNRKGNGLPSTAVQAETDGEPPIAIIVSVVVLVVLVLIAVVLGVRYYRRKLPEIVVIPLGDNPYGLSLPGIQRSNVYVRDDRTFCAFDGDIRADASPDDKEYFSWLEISRDSLTLEGELGSGEFGLVQKAMWLNKKNNTTVPVAVKTIKDSATDSERKELFKELKLMADIGEHFNIVKMIGACSDGGPLWIVVELCENGNLLNFLRKNRRQPAEKTSEITSALEPLVRVRIAFDVSKGMHYLEEKKIVHRDLAARNVLLGRNKIAKIADFGLSRDIYEQGLYTKKDGGKLPVKWMAIESLTDAVYDSKTDVWSFGVLFWEIEAAGQVPYAGIHGRELRGHLLNGFRLEKPSETPFEIHDFMSKCWEDDPDDRPNFKEIKLHLETYLEERADYLPVMMDENPADEEESYINYMMTIEDEETT